MTTSYYAWLATPITLHELSMLRFSTLVSPLTSFLCAALSLLTSRPADSCIRAQQPGNVVIFSDPSETGYLKRQAPVLLHATDLKGYQLGFLYWKAWIFWFSEALTRDSTNTTRFSFKNFLRRTFILFLYLFWYIWPTNVLLTVSFINKVAW